VEQLAARIAAGRARHGAFVAYLQPFTNTHADVQRLRQVYEPLISVPDVVGLAIGTRPDCLGEAVIEYLDELNHRTYLCVELGLQSAHDTTLRSINRGHTVEDFETAVRALAERGIYSAAHVILGLPGENAEMMVETARRVAHLPVGGVKIHQLMVIRGTEIDAGHARGAVQALSLETYAERVGEFLAELRPDQHIHRLLSDSRPEWGLVAPVWSADKSRSVAFIQQHLERRDIRQGMRYSP
jgi:radical SAM protein (TIGR01212 family)